MAIIKSKTRPPCISTTYNRQQCNAHKYCDYAMSSGYEVQPHIFAIGNSKITGGSQATDDNFFQNVVIRCLSTPQNPGFEPLYQFLGPYNMMFGKRNPKVVPFSSRKLSKGKTRPSQKKLSWEDLPN